MKMLMTNHLDLQLLSEADGGFKAPDNRDSDCDVLGLIDGIARMVALFRMRI